MRKTIYIHRWTDGYTSILPVFRMRTSILIKGQSVIYQIQEDSKNNRIPIIKNIQNLWADLRKRRNIPKKSERKNKI